MNILRNENFVRKKKEAVNKLAPRRALHTNFCTDFGLKIILANSREIPRPLAGDECESLKKQKSWWKVNG